MANEFSMSPTAGTEFIPGVRVPSRYRRATYVVDGTVRFVIGRTMVPHEPRVDDIMHVWKDGDYLDLIANKYYGDPVLWWLVADFNELTDPRAIVVGQRLRLPSLRRYQLDIAPLFI
jgi:nucleoid-associated protein YgaU